MIIGGRVARTPEDTHGIINWPERDPGDRIALDEITAFVDGRIDQVGPRFAVNVEHGRLATITVDLDRYSLPERWVELLKHYYLLAGWDHVEVSGMSRGSPLLELGIALNPVLVHLDNDVTHRVLSEPGENPGGTATRILNEGVRRPVAGGWAHHPPHRIRSVIVPLAIA